MTKKYAVNDLKNLTTFWFLQNHPAGDVTGVFAVPGNGDSENR